MDNVNNVTICHLLGEIWYSEKREADEPQYSVFSNQSSIEPSSFATNINTIFGRDTYRELDSFTLLYTANYNVTVAVT